LLEGGKSFLKKKHLETEGKEKELCLKRRKERTSERKNHRGRNLIKLKIGEKKALSTTKKKIEKREKKRT